MRFLILSALILFCGCTSVNGGECKYGTYDDEIRDEVVIPYLKEKFEENHIFFNINDPFISIKKERVAFVFVSSNTIDGKYFMYEKSIYVIRNCSDGKNIKISEVY